MQNDSITAIVLAGGQGLRMGGCDKGLLQLCDKSLVDWVIESLRQQLGDDPDLIVVSANRNQEAYRKSGYRVVGDELADYQGPLAGVLACGRVAASDYLVIAAVDVPLLPPDYIERMLAALKESGAKLAVVEAGGFVQPTHMMFERSLLIDLAQWLKAGNRKVRDWVDRQQPVAVQFEGDPLWFKNANDERQLAELSDRLCE